MSYDKIVPRDRIYWPDLVEFLNRNGAKVSGGDTISMFRKASMISPWSYWKPMVKSNDTDYIEEGEPQALEYGITVAKVENQPPAELYKKVVEEFFGLGFYYHKPKGSNAYPTEPYRFADFQGYWPNAVPPMQISLPTRVAYTTDIDEAEYGMRFGLTLNDWNGAMALHDGLEYRPQDVYSVPSGLPLWPSASSTTGDWRAGVYMRLAGGDSLEGYYTTEAVAFGGFTYKSVQSQFVGQVVEMLPIFANMPFDRYSDYDVKFGINPSDWEGVTTYAMPDGIAKVIFDSEQNPGPQAQYSKARVLDAWSAYYTDNKYDVFVKLVLMEELYEDFNEPYTSVKISICNEYDTELDSKTFYPNWNEDNIQILTAQFYRDRTFTDCHVEIWFEGKKHLTIPIREN